MKICPINADRERLRASRLTEDDTPCAGCGIADRCKLTIIVNGSRLTLCPGCRRKFEAIISETEIEGAEDMHAEEENANEGEGEHSPVDWTGNCDDYMRRTP